MTVDRLIEILSDLSESGMGEREVRIATQPNWPFENEISGVWTPDPDFDFEESDFEEPAVYIAEGTQIGYLPGFAKDCWACGIE